MDPVKGAGLLALFAAGSMAFSPAASAAHLYEYGLQPDLMGKSPVVIGIDFAEAIIPAYCSSAEPKDDAPATDRRHSPNSSADDVWCCSCDGRSFYLVTESINAENLPHEMTYRVSVKVLLDSDGSLEKTVIYGFEPQNDILVGAVFDKSADRWEISEGPVARAVWETMKPYLDQKHISYSDTWTWE